MSNSASNGEPSMDEILANIRKIIAEDPVPATASDATLIDDATDQPFVMREPEVDAVATAAHAASSPAAKPAAATPSAAKPADASPAPASPLKSRLAEQLTSYGTTSQTPSAQPVAAAPEQHTNPIDEDLEDLLDEPMPRVAQRGPSTTAAPAGEAQRQATASAFPTPAPQPAASPAATPRSSIIPSTARAVASMASAPAAKPASGESQSIEPAAASLEQPAATAAPSAAQPASTVEPTSASQEAAADKHDGPVFDRGFDPPETVRPARQRPWDFSPSRDDHPISTSSTARPSEPLASPVNVAFSATPASNEAKTPAASSPARIDFDSIVPGRERAAQVSTEGRREPSFPTDAERTLKPSPMLAMEPAMRAQPSDEELTKAVETTAAAPAPGYSRPTGLAGLGALASLSTRKPHIEPEASAQETASEDAGKRQVNEPANQEPVEPVAEAIPEATPAATAFSAPKAAISTYDAADAAPSEEAPATAHGAAEDAKEDAAGVMSLNAALERVTGLASDASSADASKASSATSKTADERTLDEAAAELLRPLVREWLDKNMPRIFERALRIEMAESVKRQLSGTAAADKPASVASAVSADKTPKH